MDRSLGVDSATRLYDNVPVLHNELLSFTANQYTSSLPDPEKEVDMEARKKSVLRSQDVRSYLSLRASITLTGNPPKFFHHNALQEGLDDIAAEAIRMMD